MRRKTSGAGHLEVLVALLELARQRHGGRVAVGQDLLAELLQQQFVEPAHEHRGAVVALHELLDRERVGRVLVAEHAREPDLVVEQQAVLAAPGHEVQREADPPQPGLRGLQLGEFARGQESVAGEFLQRLRAEMPLGDPGDGLQVAQPARALLDVRLEVVGRVVVAVVALRLLAHLGVEEIARRPQAVGRERAAHRGEQRRRPGQQARLDQRRGDADVGERLALAVVDGAHAVADLEADVPQESQEALERRGPADAARPAAAAP